MLCNIIKTRQNRKKFKSKMFLISAPVEECAEADWLKLKTTALKFSTFSCISLPKFRTAPKAELHELSKDLLQMDRAVENLLQYLLSTFEDVLQSESVNLLEHLVIQKQKYGENIINFSWNMAKYSPYLSLTNFCELFYKNFRDLDQQMKKNVATYKENLKIAAAYIITEETLATQNLTHFVSEETVIDTEYIQSVYVAVPQKLANTWLKVYETLHDSVVACSNCFIAEDDDYKLHSVVIVRDDFLEFRENCAEIGFIAREYHSDQDDFARKIHEKRKLDEATQYQSIMLIQWLQMVADEIFQLLIHIKVLRAYIGSLLRYDRGKFQIIMFYPREKSSQRLQSELRKFFRGQEYRHAADKPKPTKKSKKKGGYLPYLIYKIGFPFPEY